MNARHRHRPILVIAFALCATGAIAQRACPCTSEEDRTDPQDSIEVRIQAYKYVGVNPNEARALDKCTGLASGQVLRLDQAFRDKLCACSPKRLCFGQLESREGRAPGSSILQVWFNER